MAPIKIHEIPDKDGTILFFTETLMCKKIDNRYLSAYRSYFGSGVITENIDEKELLKIKETAIEYAERIEMIQKNNEPYDDHFSTLILNVSNDCNMRCAYCFANHGVYNSERGLMSAATAIRIVETYYNRYKSIHEIKFFGGEPLLNIDVIESVCLRITEMYESKTIDALPRFKVITNGTIITDKILEIIDRYSIKLVFSIDGPAMIHDKLRPFPNGSPTHSAILRNYDRLRERFNGKQPHSIELTYTNLHSEMGWSIADCVDHIYSELKMPIGGVNVSLVNISNNTSISLPQDNTLWQDFANTVVERMIHEHRFVGDLKIKGLIFRLQHGKTIPNRLCPAGTTWNAVSASGTVYPCLMFMDLPQYEMGNIRDNFFETERYNELIARFSEPRPLSILPCKECFAVNMCNRCAGMNSFFTGDIHKSSAGQCTAMRETLEILIKAYANGVFEGV